jgi:arginyl-tRNA synthetase
MDWPRQVSESALHREPHRITNYLQKVASAFHALWQKGNQNPTMKLVQADDLDKTYASMACVQATAFVMASGLMMLGITPKEELR